jgi:putative ABC transport system permease protein
VIRAIRDVPEPPRLHHPWRTLVLGAVGLIVGGQLFVTGVTDESAMLALIGPAIALWSSIPLLTRFTTRRIAVSLPCSFLLVYSVGAFSLLPKAFARPGIEVFFVQGMVLVFTAVALVIVNDDQFHRLSDRMARSGRGVAARLGLANPLAKRFRTALLLGMYALIIFVLVFMTVFAAVFESQAPQLANDARAGFDLRVDSNTASPVTADQLRGDRDVESVAPLTWALTRGAPCSPRPISPSCRATSCLAARGRPRRRWRSATTSR